MMTRHAGQRKAHEHNIGSAWLRGGQTLSHSADMINEIWLRFAKIILVWAILCWVLADAMTVDQDHVYVSLHFMAWLYIHIGDPLPTALTVTDPKGVEHVVLASIYDQLSYVRSALDRYFGFMWKGFWLWLLGSLSMFCFASYFFISSGKEKLESNHYRGQEIVSLRILLEQILSYNRSRAAEINQETLCALFPSKVGEGIGFMKQALLTMKVWRHVIAHGFRKFVSSYSCQTLKGPGRVAATMSREDLRQSYDLIQIILKSGLWAKGWLGTSYENTFTAIAKSARALGYQFYIKSTDLMQPRLANVPYPFKAEYEHTLIVGGTGSGKSVAIHGIIDSIKQRGDCAFVYDPDGEYIRSHYRQGIDLIFNPFDARSVGWSPYMDLQDLTNWQSSAADLFPDPKTGDPYWVLATRTIYAYTGWLLGTKMRNYAGRSPTISEFLALLVGPHDKLYEHLKHTPAANTLGDKSGPRADSLRSVLITGAERLSHLLGNAENFSITKWINDPNQKGILFLSAPEHLATTIKPILAHLSSLTLTSLLSRDQAQSKKTTWIILDEFASLGKMDSLADSPTRLRKFGGCMVVGMQQVSQIEDIYGEPKARSIIGQLRNKLILGCNDPRTGKFMSELIGEHEVSNVEQSTSFGANSIRDGVNLSSKVTFSPIAMAEEIQSLPTRTGYILFSPGQRANAFPVSKVKYAYVNRPTRAVAFLAHERKSPLECHYLEQLTQKDDGLGGLMSPSLAKNRLDMNDPNEQDHDKEAKSRDVNYLAPVESEAVRSAPHQALSEHAAVKSHAELDGQDATKLPQADKRAILDSLNDMINGAPPFEI